MATVLKERPDYKCVLASRAGQETQKVAPLHRALYRSLNQSANKLVCHFSWQERGSTTEYTIVIDPSFPILLNVGGSDRRRFDRLSSRTDAHFSSRGDAVAKTDSRKINEAIASQNNNGEQVQCLSKFIFYSC